MEKNFDIDIVCMLMEGVVFRMKMLVGYFFFYAIIYAFVLPTCTL